VIIVVTEQYQLPILKTVEQLVYIDNEDVNRIFSLFRGISYEYKNPRVFLDAFEKHKVCINLRLH